MINTDEEIIIDYLEGDPAAFTEIVDRYLKLIFNFCYRITGNQKDAEDITQEVFLKVYRNIKKFNENMSFKTWIFSIARNSTTDYLRKKKNIPLSVFDNDDGDNLIIETLVDEELGPDELSILSENKSSVEKLLDELTVIQKEVVLLKYMNEMSLSEVADTLKIPIDTAKSHHRRALDKMRKIIRSAPNLSN